MKKIGQTAAVRKPRKYFNPNREEVNQAVEQYLADGGKITLVEHIQETREYRDWKAIHDFLNGV